MSSPQNPQPAERRILTGFELAAPDIFNEAVLDRLPLGVVVLDRHGFVVKYNRFEERLARRSRHDVIGRSFFDDVAVCTNVPQIAGRFFDHITDNSLDEDIEFAFALPFLPRPRDVRLLLRSFELHGAPYGILLVEDITEKKDLERQRENLLSILMHDLNNPLQGIVGYASLLTTGSMGELTTRQRDAIHAIEESSSQLSQLIRGTLKEIRGEHRKLDTVNLHALLLSSIGNLLPHAARRRIEIVYDGFSFERTEFPRRAIVVRGIVDQLASLVQNLLSNAVKYADARIDVSLVERDGAAILEIRDDGAGIAASEHEKIFQRGYQAPDSRPGDGLGLYSVRRVVEGHGGEITVESSPRDGALFRAVLPTDGPR
ncbi:MAG: ATP-binding protein [Acidobacteriota bacterium]